LRATVEALTLRMDEQASELTALRESLSKTDATAKGSFEYTDKLATVLKRCVTVSVANNLATRINEVVNLVNESTTRLVRLDESVGQLGLKINTPSSPVQSLVGLATLQNVSALHDEFIAAGETTAAALSKLDEHAKTFAAFMTKASTLDTFETRLQVCTDLSQDALATAESAKSTAELIPRAQWTSDLANLTATTSTHKKSIEDLTQLTNDHGNAHNLCNEHHCRTIHDLNFMWEHVRWSVRSLLPSWRPPAPLATRLSMPITLQSTLLNMRHVAASSADLRLPVLRAPTQTVPSVSASPAPVAQAPVPAPVIAPTIRVVPSTAARAAAPPPLVATNPATAGGATVSPAPAPAPSWAQVVRSADRVIPESIDLVDDVFVTPVTLAPLPNAPTHVPTTYGSANDGTPAPATSPAPTMSHAPAVVPSSPPVARVLDMSAVTASPIHAPASGSGTAHDASASATPSPRKKVSRELAGLSSSWDMFKPLAESGGKSRRTGTRSEAPSPRSLSPLRQAGDTDVMEVGVIDEGYPYGTDDTTDYAGETTALDALIDLSDLSVVLPAVPTEDALSPSGGEVQPVETAQSVETENLATPIVPPGDTTVGQKPQPKPKSNLKVQFRESARTPTTWPKVDPALFHVNDRAVIPQHHAGQYSPKEADLNLHSQYFGRRPLLVTLKQEDPKTSLHMFSENNSDALMPTDIMIDSGARVFALISPKIASMFGLTIQPGTSPLRGIGGSGGSKGRTVEYLNLRLGACEPGVVNNDPFTGCFTLKIKPIVMTDEAVTCLGQHVLLGQGFIRHCLGMIDPLTERFYYSLRGGPTLVVSSEYLCHAPCPPRTQTSKCRKY
jgi:hypothetical protein